MNSRPREARGCGGVFVLDLQGSEQSQDDRGDDIHCSEELSLQRKITGSLNTKGQTSGNASTQETMGMVLQALKTVLGI